LRHREKKTAARRYIDRERMGEMKEKEIEIQRERKERCRKGKK